MIKEDKKYEKEDGYFVSGEHSPLPLDVDTFIYECTNVLKMDIDTKEGHKLVQYLVEHYYAIPKKARLWLRYSVVEA